MRRCNAIPLLAALLTFTSIVARAQDPPRPTRAQSAFGLHFDLHANMGIKNAGETLTEEMVERLLTSVKPDFIQVDCKGHPGVSSYPTQVPDATHVPGFTRDPLELIRKVTARHGVALYLHYSGVWDAQAVTQHPEWARLDADGKPSSQHISFSGPYADRILIPQLVELRNRYGADGAWVDGDCWAVAPDYRPDALEAFRAAGGPADPPKAKGQPGHRELLDFTRARFRQYVGHYLDVVHREAPGFQVASNWAFSSRMPEPVELPVDFLSGDFSPTDSVRVGAYEARCLEPQARASGKPWDLMDWSFARDWSNKDRPADPKSALQLCQSAAQVLALGGAYQAYFKQNADLSFRPADFPVMEQLGRFVRARAGTTLRSRPLPQVAILYSREGWAQDGSAPYQTSGPGARAMEGVLHALLDSQRSVEILMTHHLRGHVADYPLLVVPDWPAIEPDLASEIAAHVRAGGNVLVVGPRAIRHLSGPLGLSSSDRAQSTLHIAQEDGRYAALAGVALEIPPGEGVKPLAWYHTRPEPQARQAVAAALASVGQGKVGLIAPDLGTTYRANQSPVVRDLFTTMAQRLMPEPVVEVDGSRTVQIVAARGADNRLLVNLINTAGPHSDPERPVFDVIPPIGPLKVRVRVAQPPTRVSLVPSGLELETSFAEGVLGVTVPRVEVHEVLAIE